MEQPWKNEPDHLVWTDQTTSLTCMIHRNPVGALCGYVAVPPGHPLHGLAYNSDAADHILVHGGLTYSNPCVDPLCHVPAPGEPDDVWWFGFDCAHSGDYIPGYERHFDALPFLRDGTYRDVAYVQEECRLLALQLKGVRHDQPTL